MKVFFSLAFIFSAFLSVAQNQPSKWECDINLGDGFSLTTFLDINHENAKTIITSPKNADIRLFGNVKAILGRLIGKSPKKGVFLTVDSDRKGDSLNGIATLPVFGRLKFKGLLKQGKLDGILLQNDTLAIGNLKAKPSTNKSINFEHLFPKFLEITNKNIYSKDALQTKEWLKFQKNLKKLCANSRDDIELFIGFNLLINDLPFSHYNLYIKDQSVNAIAKNESHVFFEQKSKEIGYLQIKNFSSTQKELSTILPQIVEKKYKNLIIDLRDNGGGGIEAAREFANYIVNEQIEVGYFVTNKLNYSGFNHELFQSLQEVQPQTTEEFIETLQVEKGRKLVFHNSNNAKYEGNIYLLINGNTASTCEPIVYIMKDKKMATVIGENTAGAMLSAAPFEVFNKYKLFLPIGDFYTYDGVRLDQVGVAPNIQTTSDQALNKAMELISNKK